MALDANEVVVVYRQTSTAVERRLVFGPVQFYPEANEWYVTVVWQLHVAQCALFSHTHARIMLCPTMHSVGLSSSPSILANMWPIRTLYLRA